MLTGVGCMIGRSFGDMKVRPMRRKVESDDKKSELKEYGLDIEVSEKNECRAT